jgi:uncharacterized spore protein YtfJ
MSNTTSESLKALFAKIDDFVTTKTVVGEPIVMGETTIIPLVDVSIGVATGVSTTKEQEPLKGKDGGAGGMGAKITPTAVLVITNGAVQLVNVKKQESIDKILDMIPGILSKFNLASLFSKKEKEDIIEFEGLTEDDLPLGD